ncbi:MAG: response regulator, partial [Sphingobacteriales bacterium]
ILNPVEEVLKKEKLSAEGTENVQIVKKNAERMIRFVNQWLDLRRIQSGKFKLKLADTEVLSLLRRTIDYFAEVSRHRNIKVKISADTEKLYAKLDAENLEVIIYNLLANAFKYTSEGKNIEIQVSSVGDGFFRIAIIDEGTGVESEKLEDIFELYYTGQPGETTSKGTGIGLAFCKELVKLHNGKIYAENNDRNGLTVALELPIESALVADTEVGVEAEEPEVQISDTHEMVLTDEILNEEQPWVLLVEDNDELRVFLKRQLAEFYQVETAVNGMDGWQKAKELVPSLILSDVMMPEMDGIQMLDKLKSDTLTSHIPVVLLSAKNSVQSQIEGLKYGADLYITKPFNSDFLFAAIRNLLSKRKVHFEAIVDKKRVLELNPGELEITSKDKEFLEKVVATVEKGMEDPAFNIDKVAESIGLGRTTFYKKFKSLTGSAPVEFVREMRLKRAKQLLDAGETNVSTVAYGVGFSSAKYFSTCFREMYKMSPKEYVMTLHGKA